MINYFNILFSVIVSGISGIMIYKIPDKRKAMVFSLYTQLVLFAPVLFYMLLYKEGSLYFFFETVVIDVLVLSSIKDAVSFIIPNTYVCVLFAIGAYNLTFSHLIACIAVFVMLFVVYYFTKGGLGLGDVKILTAMALILGLRDLLSIILTSMLFVFAVALPVAIFSVISCKNIGKKAKLSEIFLPYAPLLTMGYLIFIVGNL